jgi:dTDP-4-amino-4,6-dideoxygalactose transaminase
MSYDKDSSIPTPTLTFELMKPIPFSPPRIDDKTIDAVVEVLRSGWITTGPKTRSLESKIQNYIGGGPVLCLNAWTNAVELVLRWWGVGPGDEVIIPAYTYAATANIVMHVGATPVMIDCEEDGFLIDLQLLDKAINGKTKVIMPVDFSGLPVDYNAVMTLAEKKRNVFSSKNENQEMLGRILVISDAAHSFGAKYNSNPVGREVDVAAFSFHAVKNFTTAEGGALVFNLPLPFDNVSIWKSINRMALHGQTKDALSKTQAGQWQYDIVEAGYKCNMTDLQAAIGWVEMDRYELDHLPRRKAIALRYNQYFDNFEWAIKPVFQYGSAESSYHLYALRVKGFSEEQRNALITHLAELGISTNVHFQPLPRLSYYRNLGWKESDYQNAMGQFQNEISLPIYFDLTDEQVDFIAKSIIQYMCR